MNVRAKWIDPDFRRHITGDHCCVCGRKINPARPYRRVHIIGGGHWVVHPEDEAAYDAGKPVVDDSGTELSEQDRQDNGAAQIGMDCARKLGLEWSRVA